MSQASSQWCWAASISMVFAFYGHPVSQSRIVTEVYGAPANIPAQAGIVIANELNRAWVDDRGEAFTARLTGAYDAQAGVNTLTNTSIINELDQNHPMVIGARTHAMVLTAIQYYVTPQGPNVVAAGVFDPWPGIGARGLALDELYKQASGGSLLFAATVRITDTEEEPSTPQGPTPSTPDDPTPTTPKDPTPSTPQNPSPRQPMPSTPTQTDDAGSQNTCTFHPTKPAAHFAQEAFLAAFGLTLMRWRFRQKVARRNR